MRAGDAGEAQFIPAGGCHDRFAIWKTAGNCGLLAIGVVYFRGC
jgi:hypothetical protein